MAPDPKLMRASDLDRDRTANLLREHHAVGMLDADEFSEGLDRVFTAKTIVDVDELTADLPASSVLGAMSRGQGRFSPAWQAAWGSWLCTALLLIVIWGLTGAGYPWPLWVIGPWGAIMAGRWITGSHPEGRGRGRIRGGERFDRGQLGRGTDETGGPRNNG